MQTNVSMKPGARRENSLFCYKKSGLPSLFHVTGVKLFYQLLPTVCDICFDDARACFNGQSGQYPPLSPSRPLPGDQLKLLTVTLLQSCISSSPGETLGLLVNDVIITVLSHVICRNISVYCCSLSNRIVKICVYMDKSW